MKVIYEREEGDVGIATLILFIAIIIVAAIASSLIIYVGVTLREQGEKIAKETVSQITTSLRVLNILGDRDPDGMDSNIISVKAPVSADHDAPLGGVITNVTLNSANPLSVKIIWNSAKDEMSGMWKEVIYRMRGDYQTLKSMLGDENYVKAAGKVIAVLYANFTDNRSYVDYSVQPDETYGYAIIGYDRAGNAVLYSAINQTVHVPTGTPDTTAPSGTVESIQTSGYGVIITWHATDDGSGIAMQKIYRAKKQITSSNIHNATLIAEVGNTTFKYMDYPPSTGTWYYAIVGEDRAGNSALYTATVDHVNITMADTSSPTTPQGLHYEVGPYFIKLRWRGAEDEESGILEYEIFRSKNYNALTSPAIFSKPPYAVVKNTSFVDYRYTPYESYNYLVVAVDKAGNHCDVVYPQSTLQILQIKVALGPGSQPVDFNTVIVEISDGAKDVSLKLNSSGFGINGSDSSHYSVSIVNDPTGEFEKSYILEDGAIVIMYINCRAAGLSLTSQSTAEMKLITGDGIPVYREITVPPIMLNRFVQIY